MTPASPLISVILRVFSLSFWAKKNKKQTFKSGKLLENLEPQDKQSDHLMQIVYISRIVRTPAHFSVSVISFVCVCVIILVLYKCEILFYKYHYIIDRRLPLVFYMLAGKLCWHWIRKVIARPIRIRDRFAECWCSA